METSTHPSVKRVDSAFLPIGPLEPGVGLDEHLMMATGIVVAYVGSHPQMQAKDVPGFIREVYLALRHAGDDDTVAAEIVKFEKPDAAAIEASIGPDALISFIDGKPYKSLKRHLRAYGLEPHQYRTRYGLPNDYPLVCANYSAQRSAMAKNIGLGRHGGGTGGHLRDAA